MLQGTSLLYCDWGKDVDPWIQKGEVLGEGGYGKVYKGCISGKDVAIKVVTPKGTGAELINHVHNAVESFLQEFNAVLRLQQATDFIAGLLGVSHHPNGTFCMVYELANMGALDDIPQGLDLRGGILLLSQYAHGLARMHDLRTMHGDMKPDNLLLHRKTDGSLIGRIADLGMAQILLPDYPSGVDQGGTADFMAPELDQTGLTGAVDVYAFGITMGALFSGMEPHLVEAAAKVVSGLIVRAALRGNAVAELESKVQRKFMKVQGGSPVVSSLEKLIFECSHRVSESKPDAGQVAARLEEIARSRTGDA